MTIKLILSSIEGCNLNELNALWSVLTNKPNGDDTYASNIEGQCDSKVSTDLLLKEQSWEFVPPLYLDASQESNAKHLLFYRNPIVGLGLAISQGKSLNGYINAWLGSSRCLIGFQKLNRQNSLLIDYDAFLANPSALFKHLNNIGVDFKAELFSGISLPEAQAIDGHGFLTGAILISQHRELKQTLIELQASSVLFKDWEKPSLKQAFSAIEQYQGLVVQFQNQDRLVKELMDKIEQQAGSMLVLESKHNEIQLQLTSANKASEQLLLENNNKDQALLSLKDRDSENELLVLQLHQVQEELEKIYLDKKALERSTQENKTLEEKQTSILTDMRNETKGLKQTVSALQYEQSETRSENELLVLQLHQVQEELEKIYLDKKALERSTQENKTLEEKQTSILTDMRNETKGLKQTVSALQYEQSEMRSENELLVLQLHQVQEELEYYYLDNEKYKNTVKQLKTRLVTRTSKKEKTKVNKNELRALFNKEWYKKQTGKVFRPLSHYLSKGRKSQLNPHPLFDAKYYIKHNSLDNLKQNPLIHFLSIGAINGLSPHPLFDVEWYMEMNPDVAERGINPLVHYIKFGGFEERDPCPSFSSQAYLDSYPDVQQSAINPLIHYIVFGKNEDRITTPSRAK